MKQYMTYDEVQDEATIAYYESGAQYELDINMEDWVDRWIEANGPSLMGKTCPDCGCVH